MGKIKDFFKAKGYGFYATVFVSLLSLVAAIVYAATYQNTSRFMSWAAFAVILIGVVLALLLSVTRFGEFAPAVLAAADFAALMLFIKIIYNYVAVVMVGIDLTSFEPRFIACTVLFALCVVMSIACIFAIKTL